MGAKQSGPELSLAQKRYRVNSPKGLESAFGMTNLGRHRSQREPSKPVVRVERQLSDSAIDRPRVPTQLTLDGIEHLSPISPSVPLSPFFADQEPLLLDRSQRQLIEISWKRSRKQNGADNVGSKVFLSVLCAEPEIKAIFGLEKIPKGRLKYDPRFRKHAAVINRAFDFAVKNIGFAEKLAQHFQSLGKKHVSMEGRGFRPKYWETFSDCIVEAAAEWDTGRRFEDTVASWRLLVSFIVRHMRLGFDREHLARKRFLVSSAAVPSVIPSAAPRLSQQKSNRLSTEDSQFSDEENSVESSTRLSTDFGRLNTEEPPMSPRERDPSPQSSDYFTPPSTRRQLPPEPLQKQLFAQMRFARRV